MPVPWSVLVGLNSQPSVCPRAMENSMLSVLGVISRIAATYSTLTLWLDVSDAINTIELQRAERRNPVT